MPRTAVNINERTRDLVTFLNDGVPPRADQDDHYLVCEFEPRDITSKIMSEDELYDMIGHGKETIHIVM